ncbi:MAG: hypothetical protein ACE5HI_02690 [bacterium]
MISTGNKKINGYETEIVAVEITNQRGSFRVLSYFIEKDGRVFELRGISTPEVYEENLSIFRQSLDHFDRLRNENARKVKPTRVKVVKVEKESSLKEFLADYPNDKLSTAEMAILNGLELTDMVHAGDRIKDLSE